MEPGHSPARPAGEWVLYLRNQAKYFGLPKKEVSTGPVVEASNGGMRRFTYLMNVTHV
jgi:hypothetical protein